MSMGSCAPCAHRYKDETTCLRHSPSLRGQGARSAHLLHVDRKHHPAAKVRSTYFGPVYPEAPPFKNPEADLLKIGIRRTSIIRKGTMEDGIFKPESETET